jgi:hypothetical protein
MDRLTGRRATTTFLAAALLSATPAASALAAPTGRSAPQAAAGLSCGTWYGNDNRGHGACTGTGAWTLHITCNPLGWPERTTSTYTNGYSQLAMGCGWIGVHSVWITKP